MESTIALEHSKRRLTTLSNFNNDCFLHAAIQLLYGTPSFIESLRSVCNPANSSTASLLLKLFAKMDDPSFNEILTPTSLRRTLQEEYPLGEQHDAHEVLMTLLELVRKATSGTAYSDSSDRDELMRSVASRVHWEEFAEREGRSFVVSLIYGQTSTTLSCSWCTSGETKQFDAFSTITLNAAAETPLSIDGMLSKFTSGRVTDVSLKCDKCKCTRRKAIRTSVSRLPTHLLFQINRVDDTMIMSEAIIRLQRDLDMAPYISEFIPKGEGVAKYKLYAVIDYYYTTDGGHYTITSLRDGIWYLFDDICVSQMDLPTFSSTAYLLAYTKIQPS